MARFTCVSTPDGLWTVWDDQNEVPATLGGKVLIGLPKGQAEATRNVLERIENNRASKRFSPPA